MRENFCTCHVTSCDKHPTNHEKGCDLCIQKNLARKEIPTCFFLKVSSEVDDLTEFSFESFIKFFLAHQEG